jgi:hypothetical protein
MKRIITALAAVSLALAGLAAPASAAEALPVVGGVTIQPDHAYAKVAGKVHDLGKITSKAETQAAFAGVQAKTYNGCPTRTDSPVFSGYICLYQDTNYNSGMWGASVLDFGYPWLPTVVQSHCVNLQDRSYNTGGNVNNTAGSISVTADPRPYQAGPDAQQQNWYWILFDWVNCNWGSDYIFMNVNATWSDQQLVWHRNQVGETFFWENPTSLRMVSAGVLNQH